MFKSRIPQQPSNEALYIFIFCNKHKCCLYTVYTQLVYFKSIVLYFFTIFTLIMSFAMLHGIVVLFLIEAVNYTGMHPFIFVWFLLFCAKFNFVILWPLSWLVWFTAYKSFIKVSLKVLMEKWIEKYLQNQGYWKSGWALMHYINAGFFFSWQL